MAANSNDAQRYLEGETPERGRRALAAHQQKISSELGKPGEASEPSTLSSEETLQLLAKIEELKLRLARAEALNNRQQPLPKTPTSGSVCLPWASWCLGDDEEEIDEVKPAAQEDPMTETEEVSAAQIGAVSGEETEQLGDIALGVDYGGSILKRGKKASLSMARWVVLRKRLLHAAHAAQLRIAATESEVTMTSLLLKLAQEFGGELVGLDAKFKSPESLASKIARDVNEANLKLLEAIEQKCTEAEPKANGSKEAKSGGTMVSRVTSRFASGASSRTKSTEESAASGPQAPPEGRKARRRRSWARLGWTSVAAQAADAEAALAMEGEKKRAREQRAKAVEHSAQVDIGALVWKISDALRYTVMVPTEKYTEAVKAAVERLEAQGMKPIALKNYWGDGDGYRGINNVFGVPWEESPSGIFKVEVQFHTPESFKHKSAIHDLYEEFRETKDPIRKQQIWQDSLEQAKRVPLPKGVLDVPEPRTQNMPMETILYAELVLSRAMKIQGDALTRVTGLCEGIELIGGEPKVRLLSPSTVHDVIEHKRSIRQDKDLMEAANSVDDALVISVVLPDGAAYADGCAKLRDRLRGDSDFGVEMVVDGWSTPMRLTGDGAAGGLGVVFKLTVPGEDDGVDFTPDDAYPLALEVHTQSSFRAQQGLAACWKRFKAANTLGQQQRAWETAVGIVDETEVPPGARLLFQGASRFERGGSFDSGPVDGREIGGMDGSVASNGMVDA